MTEIEFATQLRSKLFDMRKRIDNEGDVLWAVLPSAGIADRLVQGAAEAGIGDGVGVRRMNAYISVAGPECAEARVTIFRCQCTVREDDDRKRPCTGWIIDFDWDVFIASRVVQRNTLDCKYLIRP